MTSTPQTRPNWPDFRHFRPAPATASALSVAVAALLVLIKLYATVVSGSSSVLASMTDSGLDLVASLVTFFAVRYAAVPPDAEHTFGHGKAEAFASLCQAALVFASAALIGREAIVRLFDPRPIEHGGPAILVMIGSILRARARAAHA